MRGAPAGSAATASWPACFINPPALCLQDWGLNVYVLPSPECSASCAADGTIKLTTGYLSNLLEHTESLEEAMAGLLGTLLHEMGHHVFRHEARREQQSRCPPAHRALVTWYVPTPFLPHLNVQLESWGDDWPARLAAETKGKGDAERARAYLASASEFRRLLWCVEAAGELPACLPHLPVYVLTDLHCDQPDRHREREADAFATAACMALHVRPEHLAANIRVHERCDRKKAEALVEQAEHLLRWDRNRGGAAQLLGCEPADVERVAQALRDPEAFDALERRQIARRLLAKVAANTGASAAPDAGAAAPAAACATAADSCPPEAAPAQQGWATVWWVGQTSIPQDSILDCPEPAREAWLELLLDTHPPHAARIACIEAAARALALQDRQTAPAVPVGGIYKHGRSVAEQLAEQLRARWREAQRKDEGRWRLASACAFFVFMGFPWMY